MLICNFQLSILACNKRYVPLFLMNKDYLFIYTPYSNMINELLSFVSLKIKSLL